MVNNAKIATGNKIEERNEIHDLENEINDVITSCKSIIKSNYSVIKKKQNVEKKKDKKDASKVTLETVAQDMSNILENLKTHIGAARGRKDSFSDVIPKLEELMKSKHITGTSNQNKNSKQTLKPINPPGLVARPLSTPSKLTTKVNNAVGKAKLNVTQNKIVTHSKSAASTASKRPSNTSKLSIGSKKRISSNTSNRPSLTDRKWVRPAQPQLSREMYDPLGVLKDEVERAKQAEKIFTIRGCFQAVRRALLSRGWVEKYHFSYRDRVNEELKKFQHYSIQELLDMMRNKDTADVCKRLIKSKLLATHQVDLYWSYDYDGFRECPDKIKLTKMNKLRRDGYSFTSKKGLCDASKKSWFNIPGLACMNHPRTYNLVRNGDTSDFIKDFSLTAAMSLLKWVMRNSVTHECKVISPSGKIPLSVFNFALNECYKFIKTSRKEATDYPEVFEHEWNEFLENYYKIVQFGNHFKQANGITECDMVRKSNYILTHLKDHWPFLDMDGIMNIWILKPINGSQGVGIHICRTLKYILGVIKSNPNRRYIVQKYIERPLLIYNTKFDIRQWFLIGSSVPLTIWIYKHCYLRFSSQTYSLRKLHESIHLTNNSVQSRYGKYQKDIALPPYNMWDSTQFKNYLSDIGYPNVFNDIILPGMKQCIAAAVLIHKDKLDRRRRCFELQGADFILTEDFKPWLLEINSSPALHASTPVTGRMCPAVLEDVIKVVVDYEKNNRAGTGGFELIFDERIHGSKLDTRVLPTAKAKYEYTHPLHDLNTIAETIPNPPLDIEAAEYIKQIGMGLRNTLTNLLQILKNEKEKRQFRKNKSIETISSNNIITESRRASLTRKAGLVSQVASGSSKESPSSSIPSKTSSEVTVKGSPESSQCKSVSVEKVSVSTNMENLQLSSATTLLTIQELSEAINKSDIILADKSASCVVIVREIATSTSSHKGPSRNNSKNQLPDVLEKPEPSCEILICPLETLQIIQSQSKTKMNDTDPVVINEIPNVVKTPNVFSINNNILNIIEKFKETCAAVPKRSIHIRKEQTLNKTNLEKTESGATEEFSTKDMEMLNIPSPPKAETPFNPIRDEETIPTPVNDPTKKVTSENPEVQPTNIKIPVDTPSDGNSESTALNTTDGVSRVIYMKDNIISPESLAIEWVKPNDKPDVSTVNTSSLEETSDTSYNTVSNSEKTYDTASDDQNIASNDGVKDSKDHENEKENAEPQLEKENVDGGCLKENKPIVDHSNDTSKSTDESIYYETMHDQLNKDEAGLKEDYKEIINVTMEKSDIKWIKKDNTDTEISNTSSIQEYPDFYEPLPLSTFEEILMDTSRSRDKHRKSKNITYQTNKKTQSIKDLVKRSLNHLLRTKKKKIG